MADPQAADTHAADAHLPGLAHHFDSYEQQQEASFFGMWVFLATEVMFFGGLFLAYVVYRSANPIAFNAGSNELDITLGAINTGILIGSSLTMAMAVHAAQLGKFKAIAAWMGAAPRYWGRSDACRIMKSSSSSRSLGVRCSALNRSRRS